MFKKRIIQIANVLAEKSIFFTTILFRVIETKIFIICSVFTLGHTFPFRYRSYEITVNLIIHPLMYADFSHNRKYKLILKPRLSDYRRN